MNRIIKLGVLSLITVISIMANAKSIKLKSNNIDAVINAMTLEEKVDLLIGTGMDLGGNDIAPVIGATENIVPGAAGTNNSIDRLAIPSVVLADGPAGLRINATRKNDDATYYCTHFPIGTLLACTWNVDLVQQVGAAIGNEAKEYGADVLLAPALNIQRNPLCGRNFEYYSEDPLLSGKIASAYVRGVQSNNVGTSVKHFAANNQETNRMGNDARVSERALREIYLKGFEIAVKEAKPWTVMSSYNRLNGIFTAENYDLLTTKLRDEWGFDGMVMSDWYGGNDAAKMVAAGNDMMQPGYDKQRTDILDAVKAGTLDVATIDRAVKRVLEMIVKTNRFNGYKYSNKPDLKAHSLVSRQSAGEGMVLLKNDDSALPIDNSVKNVALYGIYSYDFIPGGTGSGNVNRAYTATLIDGLDNMGFNIDEQLRKIYDAHLEEFNSNKPIVSGIDMFLPPEMPKEVEIPVEIIAENAKDNDVAIITIGRISGEFFDRKTSDFLLSDVEEQLISNVADAFHAQGKKVVVVLNVGSVIDVSRWQDNVDAVLCAWQGGQESGNSVADVLSGVVNPSGKLSMTWPIKITDHWSSLNFPIDQKSEFKANGAGTVRNDRKDIDYTDYDEGIYVGYRYFDTKNKSVAYPFGYGMSYTSFSYGAPTIELIDDNIKITFNVTNIGSRAGKETAQLYVSAPKGYLDKPTKELKGFAKTRELQSGESQELTITVKQSDLASFDENLNAWVVDAGEYEFIIGASVSDLRGSSKITLPQQIRNIVNTNK
jgi:beta-glucosidase